MTDTQSQIDHLIVDLRAAASLGRAITADEVDDIEKRLSAALAAPPPPAASEPTTPEQEAARLKQARRIFREYAEPNSQIDSGNLYWALGVALRQPAASEGPQPAPGSAEADSWEENARYMLDRCPYTVWQRPGGRVVDLKSTFIATFRAMQMRLDGDSLYTAQTGSAEPVAQWQIRAMLRDGTWGEWRNVASYEVRLLSGAPDWEARALYASPPADARDAKDAERWRYWRDNHGWTGYFDDGLTNSEVAEDVDAAADAAIAASKAQQGGGGDERQDC